VVKKGGGASRCVAYLMSSMARRAEPQTTSRTTELLAACCLWIFDHLGQTRETKE